jgi:mannose-6-phosphate isomerase-like protein (cupin superfamily)
MNRQNLFADVPWDGEGTPTGLRRRVFWRPDDARMGATLYELDPGYDGDRVHMHYGREEMFFVLSGRVVVRNLEGAEELGAGDFLFCPEGRAGLHAFSNPDAVPARILAMSAASYPEVVAYPEEEYAWVATRVPELPPGDDPGLIARFEFQLERPDQRVGRA